MLLWLKKNTSILITGLVTCGVLLFIYACEPKVTSLNNTGRSVTRAELQIELDSILAIAKMRMIDLDKQDAFRNLVLQNSLLIMQGQPFNPMGIVTAIAAIYGVTQGGCNITKVVKNKIKKRKDKNGHT